MAKTWRGQHIKRDRGFQQKIAHCKKIKCWKGFVSLLTWKWWWWRRWWCQKPTHPLLPYTINNNNGNEGEHINYSCNYHTQGQWGTREHINDAHKTMHNKQWRRCLWACLLKEEGDKETNEDFQPTMELFNLLLVQQKNNWEKQMRKEQWRGRKIKFKN